MRASAVKNGPLQPKTGSSQSKSLAESDRNTLITYEKAVDRTVQLVPRLAAMVDEIVIGFEDTIGEPVVTHEL